MNVYSSYSQWHPDQSTRNKSLAMTVGIHAIIGFMIVYATVEVSDKKPDLSVLKAFNIVGPQTPEPVKEKVAISDAKSMEAVIPIPSDDPVSVIAFLDGGSGGDELIWTPPQPEFTYGGAEDVGPSWNRTYYVDVPDISGDMENKPNNEPVFIRFDGLLMIETSKAFAELGSNINAQLLAEIAVDEEGKTLGCSILEGQVSDSIDSIACLFLMGNIYKPAIDRNGNPTIGFVKANLLWDGERFLIRHGDQLLSVNEKGEVVAVSHFDFF